MWMWCGWISEIKDSSITSDYGHDYEIDSEERDESQNRPIPRETRDGLYFQAERDNVYASYMRFMIRDRGRKFNQEWFRQ